ncbi:MAG: ABC transporter ATP-binding protein [Streptosporangiaceae bacterium]
MAVETVDPLLRVEGLEAGHGAVQALWGVDLTVRRGEVVVVLGANGAGKSTLLSAIAGHLPLLGGRVLMEGEDLTRLAAARRARLGLTIMTEQAVFPELSVRENLRLGAWRLPRREARSAVEESLGRFPELRGRLREPAGRLSGGQRKLLGLAKSLAGRPRALMLDEPSAGLSPRYVKEVIAHLTAFRDRGPAMLLAEQNVAFLELADRVYVLEGGRVRFDGTVADLRRDETLASAFFGIEGNRPS